MKAIFAFPESSYLYFCAKISFFFCKKEQQTFSVSRKLGGFESYMM
jgi:hypothetical protein